MKFKLYCFVAILLLASGTALPNGLSLNSIGPKGFGMGGAFVGLANDYTAIYWNPGGLTQMQKNFIGVFATDIMPKATYKFTPAHIDTKTKTNHYIAPNLMGFYHFDLVENLTFGLGVYIPAGIGAEWDGNDLKNLVGGANKEWMSKVAVLDISPAVAYKFSDQFSAGVALNIFYGMFDLKKPAVISHLGVFQFSETSKGWGYGVTLGGLFKANEQLSIGLSFRTKTTVKMTGTATNPGMAAIPLLGAPGESDFDRDVAWPLWVAGGIAYRPMDKLVITFDVQFSQWSQSENKFTAKYNDAKWNSVLSANGSNQFILRWSDATQVRLGGCYSVDENLDLRAGFYTDPAPAPVETYSVLFPSISYKAVTVGAGYKVNDFVIDLGLEYLFGKDREVQLLSPAIDARMPGTHGMNIPAWSLGVGYQF